MGNSLNKGFNTILSAIYLVVLFFSLLILLWSVKTLLNMPRQMELPLRYRIKKTRASQYIENFMNFLSFISFIGILQNTIITFGLKIIQIWIFLFITMGALLIEGLDKFVRSLISLVAFVLFVFKVEPSLASDTVTLMIVYIGFYFILKRKSIITLDLIANALSVGTAVKLLYLNWPLITAHKNTAVFFLYGFIFILLLLLLPLREEIGRRLEELGRLLVASFAGLSLIRSLSSQIPPLNLLIFSIALLIYLSLLFKLRGGTHIWLQ